MAGISTIAYCTDQDVYDIYPRISQYDYKVRLSGEWSKSGSKYTLEDFKFICEHASRDADYVYEKIIPYIKKREEHMSAVRGWKGTMDDHIIYSLKKGIFKDETKNYL